MGFYIQIDTPKAKANALVIEHDATLLINGPPKWEEIPADKALICVVNNGAFEAAALCFDDNELHVFTMPDRGNQRKCWWLLMDKTLAHKLAHYTQKIGKHNNGL